MELLYVLSSNSSLISLSLTDVSGCFIILEGDLGDLDSSFNFLLEAKELIIIRLTSSLVFRLSRRVVSSFYTSKVLGCGDLLENSLEPSSERIVC